jgi:hypothetical protein
LPGGPGNTASAAADCVSTQHSARAHLPQRHGDTEAQRENGVCCRRINANDPNDSAFSLTFGSADKTARSLRATRALMKTRAPHALRDDVLGDGLNFPGQIVAIWSMCWARLILADSASPRLRGDLIPNPTPRSNGIRLSLVKASTLPNNNGHFLPQHRLDYSVRQVL